VIRGGAARGGERAVAIALLAIGLYVLWTAHSMPAGSVALPGPGFFPTALGALLALTAAAILAGAGGGAPERATRPRRETVVAVVALAIAMLLFERLGAIVTLALLLAALLRALARLSWPRAALAGVLGSLLAWLVFARLLGVALPGLPF
jgi:hypothetical protein